MANTTTLLPTLDPFSSTKPRETIRPQEIGGSTELDTGEVLDQAQKIIKSGARDLGQATGDLFFGEFLGIKSAPEGTYAESASLQEAKKQTALRNGQTEIKFNNPDEFKYIKILRSVQALDKKVEQVTEVRDLQEEVRQEINGLSDEDFAKKAGYKNTGFRGFLRTIANRAWVSLQLIGEKLGLIKPKASGEEIFAAKGKTVRFEMGENELLKGGENKGGHWSQAPG